MVKGSSPLLSNWIKFHRLILKFIFRLVVAAVGNLLLHCCCKKCQFERQLEWPILQSCLSIRAEWNTVGGIGCREYSGWVESAGSLRKRKRFVLGVRCFGLYPADSILTGWPVLFRIVDNISAALHKGEKQLPVSAGSFEIIFRGFFERIVSNWAPATGTAEEKCWSSHGRLRTSHVTKRPTSPAIPSELTTTPEFWNLTGSTRTDLPFTRPGIIPSLFPSTAPGFQSMNERQFSRMSPRKPFTSN